MLYTRNERLEFRFVRVLESGWSISKISILVNEMNRKRLSGRLGIRWLDVVVQDMAGIKWKHDFWRGIRQRETERFDDGTNISQCANKSKTEKDRSGVCDWNYFKEFKKKKKIDKYGSNTELYSLAFQNNLYLICAVWL